MQRNVSCCAWMPWRCNCVLDSRPKWWWNWQKTVASHPLASQKYANITTISFWIAIQVLFSCFARIAYLKDLNNINLNTKTQTSKIPHSGRCHPVALPVALLSFRQTNVGLTQCPLGLQILHVDLKLVNAYQCPIMFDISIAIDPCAKGISMVWFQSFSDQWMFPNDFRREMTGCKLRIRFVVTGGTKLCGKSSVLATTNGRNNNCGWDWLGMDGIW